MMNQTPYLVGVGAANVDFHGKSRKGIVLRDSNPGFMHTSAGGVTRNILENSARQGLRCALLTAVSSDFAGQTILNSCTAVGIDVSRVLIKEDLPSSTYMAMMDESGDMFVGVSDMRILQSLTPEYLEEHRDFLQNATAIVCDGCLPQAFLEQLLALAKSHVPVFIDPVSTAYAKHIEPLIGSFYMAKPNRLELGILSGMPVDNNQDVERAAERVLARGTRCVVVSLGSEGCYYADAEGRRMFRKLRPVQQMANATGAGDAFMAGFLHGFVSGMTLEEQLDYALASGIVAIQSPDTIHPGMSDLLVKETLDAYRIYNFPLEEKEKIS